MIKVVVVVKKLTEAFSEVFYMALPEDNTAVTHLNNTAVTHLNNMAVTHRNNTAVTHRSRATHHRGIHRNRATLQLVIHRSRATLHKGTHPLTAAVILEVKFPIFLSSLVFYVLGVD